LHRLVPRLAESLTIALVAMVIFFIPAAASTTVDFGGEMSVEKPTSILDTRTGESRAQKFAAILKREDEDALAKRKAFNALTDAEKLQLKYSWEFWARPNQFLPDSSHNWQTWLIMAGRGFGKTRTGAEAVRKWAKKDTLVNIIAPTADDARDVCIEGESGILAICPNGERPEYVPSKRRLEWPNGAISMIFTADEPERLRGKQHKKLWCDELAAWRYCEDAWDQAQLGLRLGGDPQAIVTTTPKPIKQVRDLVADPTTFLTRGTSYENRLNLAKAFYARIITKYEGTRLGRQELNAELLEDRPGALWTHALIDENRIKNPDVFWKDIYPKLVRIVTAVDPAVSSNEDSDETGIVSVGMDDQNPAHFYPFDDRSDIYTPDGWAKAAAAAYWGYKSDRVVGEVNNGGEMVESTLRHVNENISYTAVHASRGKITRAEPISALYEQKRVHHVGALPQMEDQMCDYDPVTATFSPDRMDALVWAITELSEGLTTLGFVEYLKGGKAEEELKQISKVSRATTLAKPEVADAAPRCPACESAVIQDIPGGEKKCVACGKQFRLGEAPPVVAPASRADYLLERSNHR